jgi:hypothetical protein
MCEPGVNMQTNITILIVPYGAWNTEARIPAAEQFPWSLRYLNVPCTIGILQIETYDTRRIMQWPLRTIAERQQQTRVRNLRPSLTRGFPIFTKIQY